MSRAELYRERLREAAAVTQMLLDDVEGAETVETVARLIAASLTGGGKILLCGNGGSAADAQHLAAEFLGRFRLDRRPYAAIALADNVAALSAIANDYAYREVFARGVTGLGRAGDVLIALSTSGRSENVVAALEAARTLGLVTVAFVGAPGSPMERAADHVLRAPGPNTARIQEAHILIGHTIAELVEQDLYDLEASESDLQDRAADNNGQGVDTRANGRGSAGAAAVPNAPAE